MSNYSTLYKILSGLIDNVTNLNSKQEAETSLLLSANIGSTGSNTNVVEKLSAEFTPAESDLGKVYLWSVDDTTNMKKGHIYKVSSKEVTTTTESSGGTTTSTEYYLEDITVIGSSTDDSNLSSQVNTNTSNISSLSASIGDINTALANILNE